MARYSFIIEEKQGDIDLNIKPNTQINQWTEDQLRTMFADSKDILIKKFRFAEADDSVIVLIYSEGTIDTSLISRVIMPELASIYNQKGYFPFYDNRLLSALPVLPLEGQITPELIIENLFQGELLLLFPQANCFFKIDIGKLPTRQPEESTTEISIKGPKDGFVENIVSNVALIRKRLRTQSLCFDTTVLGRRTQTKIGLLYIDDIIAPQVLDQVKSRLKKMDVDGIYSIGQLEEALSDFKYSLFPLLDFTGRPDYAVSCLLNGRFIIVIDGSPLVLIGPINIWLTTKSPEDVHFGFQYVSFVRIIRMLSLLLGIFLPGFWVALTAFHQDQIPFRLMATIATARQGLPFSAQLEMLFLLILIEMFREASFRLPSSFGSTLTVVGGLVIGEASIRSGLVSPSVVVVGGITAIAGATLVNQTLSTNIVLIRLFVFFASGTLGLYGFILSMIAIFIYLSKLKSFGVPYLSPYSPPQFRDILPGLLRLPWSKMRYRPRDVEPIDPDHKGEDGS